MGAQQLGRGVVKINGTPCGNEVDFTLDLGGTKRTAKPNASSTSVNYTESTEPSKLEFNLPVESGVSVLAIQGFTDATVSVEADTGQVWTIPSAWAGDTQSIAGSSGTAKISIMGDPAQETT